MALFPAFGGGSDGEASRNTGEFIPGSEFHLNRNLLSPLNLLMNQQLANANGDLLIVSVGSCDWRFIIRTGSEPALIAIYTGEIYTEPGPDMTTPNRTGPTDTTNTMNASNKINLTQQGDVIMQLIKQSNL